MPRSVTRSLLVATLAVWGCIDDPTFLHEDPIPITEAEAELLGLQVFFRALASRAVVDDEVGPVASLLAGPPAATAAPETVTAVADTVVACELSGDVRTEAELRATMDPVADTARLEFLVVQTHEDCRQEEEGVTWTLLGAPDLTMDLIFSVDPAGRVTLDGTLEGAVVLFTGGRSLPCEVALGLVGREDGGGSVTYSVSGSMCGVAVDESTTEPPG
jgi:hypothetical protein